MRRADQSSFLTGRSHTGHGGRVTDVLMVTTSVRMLDGFIAHPRTRGHELRFTLYLWNALPAFKTGLSRRPPPATMPTMARESELTVLRVPLGRRTRDFLPSSLWPTMMHEVPEVRAKVPRSPILSSSMDTMVPGGRAHGAA